LYQCEALGFKPYQIVAAQGPFTQRFNEALWEQLKIDVVISKESGKVGGTDEKIKACLELGIPIIVLQRPQSKKYDTVQTMEEFLNRVEELK
jgi:precorrin-6A/cobalt-precorrin-6A reductase